MHRIATGAKVILVLACAAAANRVQGQRTSGVIDGLVTDSSLLPLANATVSVVGTPLQLTTGEGGRFRFRALAPGSYVLLVRHVGFEPQSANTVVSGEDTLRVTIMLERLSPVLDTVTVVAGQTPLRLAEFEERRALGVGRFLTEAEIAKRNSVSIAELFRTLLQTRQRFGGASRACEHPQWFVDGVPAAPQSRVEWLPSPKDLAGIEYYSSPATTPLQYKATGGGGFCGVILMWTK